MSKSSKRDGRLAMEQADDRLEPEFRTLGLQPGATLEEVEQAHRQLALSWHPDRLPDVPGLKESARKKRQEIEAAAATLKAWYERTQAASGTAPLSASGHRASLFDDIFSGKTSAVRNPWWIAGGAALILALILAFALPGEEHREDVSKGESPSVPVAPPPATDLDTPGAEGQKGAADTTEAARSDASPAEASVGARVPPQPKTASPPPPDRQGPKPRLIRKN